MEVYITYIFLHKYLALQIPAIHNVTVICLTYLQREDSHLFSTYTLDIESSLNFHHKGQCNSDLNVDFLNFM